MTEDGTLARIRALLANAEDENLTEPAREAYNAKARELIAKYGIDEMLLNAGRPQPSAPGRKTIVMDAPYALDKIGLLSAVAQALGCQTVQTHTAGRGPRKYSLHLFGMEADLTRAELLYTSLLIQQSHELAQTRPPYYEDAKAYKRSWMSGYRVAVYARLKAAEAAAKARAEADREAHAAQAYAAQGEAAFAGPSVALVLADKAAAVQRAVEEAFPSLRQGRARALRGSGRDAGYAAGKRANLGGTGVAAGRRRALGVAHRSQP